MISMAGLVKWVLLEEQGEDVIKGSDDICRVGMAPLP